MMHHIYRIYTKYSSLSLKAIFSNSKKKYIIRYTYSAYTIVLYFIFGYDIYCNVYTFYSAMIYGWLCARSVIYVYVWHSIYWWLVNLLCDEVYKCRPSCILCVFLFGEKGCFTINFITRNISSWVANLFSSLLSPRHTATQPHRKHTTYYIFILE